MRVEGLVFAGVATSEPAALAEFFADVLGAERIDEGAYHRVLFPNGSALAIVPPGWVPPPSDTNLGFLVDDLDKAAAELEARGVRPDGEPAEGDGLRYRHFRAPDGRVFELIERS